MTRLHNIGVVLWATVVIFPSLSTADPPRRATENVLWVMLDGLRWQEVFTGVDEALLDKPRGGVADVEDIRERFWRETPVERREALLPFLWTVVARKGQIYGNGPKQSVATVTNKHKFSYPGYNEVLCGFADEWVKSNDKIYNRNTTVLEWLHEKPQFHGKVAAFTSWDVFPYIINDKRSGIPVNAGLTPLQNLPQTPELTMLNRLMREVPLYAENTRPDAMTFHAAKIYLETRQPRILFVSFDETDVQGHAGRYDRVLDSAQKNDSFVRELWETAQSIPHYKGKTSLIITTDHGRGNPPVEWKSHSAKIAGAEYIWAAFLGPDTPPAGEQRDVEPITQSQIAATVSAMLGFDYCAEQPKAAPPIDGALTPR